MKRRIALISSIIFGMVWFSFFRPLNLGGPASFIIVSGLSMEPILDNGDLAVLQRQKSYQQGEIVAFRVPGGLVIHRIVGGSPVDGYITQGDNKDATDPWQPLPEEIVGRLWFHVPGGGLVLQRLRRPQILIALGGLASLMLMDNPDKNNRHKRRKKSGKQATFSGVSVPLPMLSLLAASAVAALALVALAIYGFRRPVEQLQKVTRLRYEHLAAFQYSVHTEPSILYPQDLIGPIGPPTDALTNTVAVPPVFTRLAHSIDLDFTYQLNSSLPADVSGELTPMLQVKAGEGWTRTSPIARPTKFSGPSASARMSLDFTEVLSLIEAVEEQTGFTVGTYDVAIIPTLHLEGRIGQEAIDDTYAPAFGMQLDHTRISLDPELIRSETRTLADEILRPQEINLLGFAIPVRTIRLVSVIGAAFSLVLAGLLFAFVFLGLGQGEVAHIQARYGGSIISVASVELDASQTIRVASMGDLVRLAQRDGRIIMRQELEHGVQLYFITDGQIIYTYPVVEPIPNS